MKRYLVHASRDDVDWRAAAALSDFRFPWEPTPPPHTEFRALTAHERLHFRFASIDGRDDRLEFLDVALVLGADKPSDQIVDKLGYVHEWLRNSLTVLASPARQAAATPQR